MAIKACMTRTGSRVIHGIFGFALALLIGAPIAAADEINDTYRDQIDGLKIVHLSSLAQGILLPPPGDKVHELAEYGTNIALKAIPPVVVPPPSRVVKPNAEGSCAFKLMANEHLAAPVADFENIYGVEFPKLPNYGFLSKDGAPDIYHHNSGAYVTVRRNLVETLDIPEPWYPAQKRQVVTGQRILFSHFNDMEDEIRSSPLRDGYKSPPASETFPIGRNALEWSAETKIDILFDIVLDPVLFLNEMKHSSKAAAKAAQQKRFARIWDAAAVKWARSLDPTLFEIAARKGLAKMKWVKRQVSYNEIEDKLVDTSGYPLTSWPTGAINRQYQELVVLDEVPPTIVLGTQPEPFEANSLGGEFGSRHFDELRNLLEVSDNCDRPVQLDERPQGNPYWPVNQTTQLRWCGRDMGPTSVDGGFNEACADIAVSVVDTRPPILLTPPSVNLIAGSGTPEIGWPGVFDVADPNVQVSNDAPTTFAPGRTPVTWTATDGSNNSVSATQWVNIKPDNTPPVALSGSTVTAVSFEPTRIELRAEDLDLLDGRYDQLSFRISDTPDHGFFVAPLFPYFINDHRQHQINPDGSYSSFNNRSREACEQSGTAPDITSVLEPFYVTVTDDDVMYVMDSYLTCDAGTAQNPAMRSRYRIARFVPDAGGALHYASHYEIRAQPGDRERHLFIDHEDQLWFVTPGGNQVVTLAPDLSEVNRIPFDALTEINPSTGAVVRAFPDQQRRVQSVAVDRNQVLYATDGSKLLAYDLTRREDSDPSHYKRLPPVAFVPGSGVDTSREEPWRSYESFLGGGYADLVLDSEGNIYVSDPEVNRIWKFRALKLSADRSEVVQQPELVGWLGRCSSNLDATILACDTRQQRSIGFSCQDDLCGYAGRASGQGQGQFNNIAGLAMSPQDVLYATDTGNYRVQRFTTDGFFAGEAVSECQGSCFVLGDFGFVTNIAVNSNFLYLLDVDENLTHIFETTPITDIDDQTMSQTQSAFVQYSSNNNYVGNDSFSFFALDGLAASNEAVVNVNVTRNHRAPLATPNLTFAGREDTPFDLALSGLDPDGDTLDFLIDSPPEHGSIDRVADRFVYTPDPDFYGEDSFRFRATDAPSSSPPLRSEPETVRLRIAPVNDPPELQADAPEDAGIGFANEFIVLLTDIDVGDEHLLHIEWGDGQSTRLGNDDLIAGTAQGATLIVGEHIYTRAGSYTIRACASDDTNLPKGGFSCLAPTVNARVEVVQEVVEMADIRLAIEDSLAKTPDPDTPAIDVSAPLLDGTEPVTYTIDVLNNESDSDYISMASNVTLEVSMPAELSVQSYASDSGACSMSGRKISCALGNMNPNARATVTVEATGTGRLIADEIVTVHARALADQRATGSGNAGSIQTRLLVNGDFDLDGDGVANRDDAFPDDPSESVDTDNDGIGNNADRDDDGDSMPDWWETRYGLGPLRASDRSGDLDGDGLSNELEYLAGTRPDVADSDNDRVGDAADNCPRHFNPQQFDTNNDFLGDVCDPRSFAGVAAIGDADGDAVPDAALVRTAGGHTDVFSKSGASDLDIAAFALLGEPEQSLRLLGLKSLPSVDGQPISLLYSKPSGEIRAAVHAPWLGTRVGDYLLVSAADELKDAAASRNDALLSLLLVSADQQIHVRTMDLASGTEVSDLEFFGQDADRVAIAIAAAQAGSRAVTVVVAEDNRGRLYAEAQDTRTGAPLGLWQVATEDSLAVDVLGLDDGFAVMTLDINGVTRLGLWSLQSEIGRFEIFDDEWTPIAMARLDRPGNAPRVAVAAANAGNIEIRSFDASSDQPLNSYAFAGTDIAARSLYVGNTASNGAASIGILGSSDTGVVRLEQRSIADGELLTVLTTNSVSPPPPPPPPEEIKLRGGIGSMGIWVGLLGLFWYLRRQRRVRCRLRDLQ